MKATASGGGSFTIFAQQAWADYIPDEQTLRLNVQTLENERNTAQVTVKWLFSSQDSRVKFHRLYPSISD